MKIDLDAIENHVAELIARDVVTVLQQPAGTVPVEPVTPYIRTLWVIAARIRQEMDDELGIH